MSIAFQSVSPAASGSAATATGDIALSGVAARQLLIGVFGYEGVSTSITPQIVSGNPPTSGGWFPVCFQAPSSNGGNALEVWAALWQAGSVAHFGFASAQNFVAQILTYSGIYDPGGTPNPLSTGIIRAAVTAQVAGNNPAVPSGFAFANEGAIAVAADQLASPGYGNLPSPWSAARFDSARAGTFGNVEITAADQAPLFIDGTVGPSAWTATGASGGVGATALLFVRPSNAVVAAGTPYISARFPAS